MRPRSIRSITIVTFTLFAFLLLPKVCFAQNIERQFLLAKDDATYRLTLSITHSLYEHYQQKDHQLTLDAFAEFVTPYSLSLVAADIRSIFPDEEEFVNAVLTFIRQIPYQPVEEGRYPVETIVDNFGDCDLFSFTAASLLTAQNMDVVLFYYEAESHMNIGVNLSTPPEDARIPVSYVSYGGVRYYVAECTGDDWQNSWRVGELPSELEGADVNVVTLENCELISPGQVSSSFGPLQSTTISLMLSSSYVVEGNPVIISGQVQANDPEGTVVLYGTTGDDWSSLGEVELDSLGRYVFSWNPTEGGLFYVKASWSGDSERAGADSEVVSIYVLPEFLVWAGGGFVVIAIISVVLFLMHRTTRPQGGHLDEDYEG
jgi:hypothetical protein